MSTQYDIDVAKWAEKVFGLPVKLGSVRLESTTYNIGFCETCSYEVSAVIISAQTVGGMPLSQIRDADDLGSLVREIYEVAVESGQQLS